MGSSISRDDSFSRSISLKSCLYTIEPEELCEKPAHTCYNREKNVKEIILLEDFENSIIDEEDDTHDILANELGYSLVEMLKIQEDELLCETSPTVEEVEICNQMEVVPHSDESEVWNWLDNHASEVVQLYSSSDAEDELICSVEGKSSSNEENFMSLQPLLTPTKLLSALRGSRSQDGNHLNAKLNVKWASEVYDPPVTSSSHTMKGAHRRHHHHHHHHHHQRTKSKKDNYNYKCIKGKSSKGSVNDKKYAHRKSSCNSQIEPRISRLHVLSCSKTPLLNGCNEPEIEPLGSEVSCNKSINMYGSSCYAEPPAPLLLNVAKAS